MRSGSPVQKNGSYLLSEDARTYLSRNGPQYLEDISLGIAAPWEWSAFGHLADAVRTGKSTISKYMEGADAQCLDKMVLAIGTVGRTSAERICDFLEIGSRPRERLKVLDLACSSGVYGFTMARREPKAEITSVDRRQIIRLAQKIGEQMALGNRVTYRAGNAFSLKYAPEEYDLVLISNVLHQYGGEPTKELFRKAFDALRPDGGMIAVHDFVADDQRCQESVSLLMGVDMLLYTDDGDAHTYSEYRSWLEETGFQNVAPARRIPSAFTSLITAMKP